MLPNPHLYDREKLYTYTPSLEDDSRSRDTPLKYDRPTGPYSEFILSKVKDYIIHRLYASGFSKRKRLLFAETVARVQSWDSSPGYPFVTRFKDKKQMIDDAAELLERDFYSDRWNGVFSDFPKGDEMLKPGKRIRQIAGVEFPLGLKALSFCSDFNISLNNNASLPIMLGISITRWRRIIDIKKQCRRGAASDATDHDASVAPCWLDLVRDIRLEFLDVSASERELFINLYIYLKNKNLIDIDGILFRTPHGMASGWICTAEDNSLISWAKVLYYVFSTYEDPVSVLNNHHMLIYGDDLWLGYIDESGPIIDLEHFRNFWWQHNYIVKAEEWVDPFSADFLSIHEKHFPVGNNYFIIPVTTRPQKMLDAMDFHYTDIVDDPVVILQRLLQLRSRLVGTPQFSEATIKVQKYIDTMSPSMNGINEWDRTKGNLFESEYEIAAWLSGQSVPQCTALLN